MTRPCDLDAVLARRLIGEKKLSPVELLDSCIEQVDRINPTVNALTAKSLDRARKEASAAEEAVMRGDHLPILHGLPIGIKDLNMTEGLVTTFGSPIYKDNVPDHDDHCVAAARRAGAIVMGKTNIPEFGGGGNTNNKVYGPTRSPFDLTKTCGGSSGGSGVVLATNMMPLATGSDTGGSLRVPASFNGVVAFRSSPGVVAYERRATPFSTFQTQGPMGRTVSDTALLLAAMAERTSLDPMVFPLDPMQFLDLPEVDISTLKVVVSEDLGISPVTRAIRVAFKDRLARFRNWFASCEARDPDLRDALDVFWYWRGIFMLSAYDELFDEHSENIGPNIHGNIVAARKMDVRKIGWASRQQYRLIRDFQTYMQDFDVLICPTSAVAPWPYADLYPTEVDGKPMENYVSWAALTSSLTLVGNPVAVIPCGLDEYGTPFGIQIVGKMYKDRDVLAIARALETAFKADPVLARPMPDLAMLASRSA